MKCKLPMLLPFLLNMLWAQPSAKEIIEKSDQLMRGKTMSGRYEMVVTTEEWERSMTFSFISEGTEKSFIRIEKPAKENLEEMDLLEDTEESTQSTESKESDTIESSEELPEKESSDSEQINQNSEKENSAKQKNILLSKDKKDNH